MNEKRTVKRIKIGIFNPTLHDRIVSPENLFAAWREFQKGKKHKPDVINFYERAEENIIDLHRDLVSGTYGHGLYEEFKVCDPKPRTIHKAEVRDRILHRAIYRQLYSLYEKIFIFDSYSSINNKGTLKAIQRFNKFALKLSENNTKRVWVLHCDVKKFFYSINYDVLENILSKKIKDSRCMNLLGKVIRSFKNKDNLGIPLGNLTSQLFANIYLNEFDQFVKRVLRVKYYIRYADDLFVLSRDRGALEKLLECFRYFLKRELSLKLHDDNAIVLFSSGADCLGCKQFPFHSVMRTKTKKRMINKINKIFTKVKKGEVDLFKASSVIASYLGGLKHMNEKRLESRLKYIHSKICGTIRIYNHGV